MSTNVHVSMFSPFTQTQTHEYIQTKKYTYKNHACMTFEDDHAAKQIQRKFTRLPTRACLSMLYEEHRTQVVYPSVRVRSHMGIFVYKYLYAKITTQGSLMLLPAMASGGGSVCDCT
jgi:hypothetical protein